MSVNAPPTADPTPDPSPPRAPQTRSEGIKLVGGLIVVCVGLAVILVVALVSVAAVAGDRSQIVAIATSSFGVIGTTMGAYFGLKIGNDGTQAAVSGLRDEAAKAQAFAAHVPAEHADAALAAAAILSSGSTGGTGGGAIEPGTDESRPRPRP